MIKLYDSLNETLLKNKDSGFTERSIIYFWLKGNCTLYEKGKYYASFVNTIPMIWKNVGDLPNCKFNKEIDLKKLHQGYYRQDAFDCVWKHLAIILKPFWDDETGISKYF